MNKGPFKLTDRQAMLLYMARLEALVSSQSEDLELFIEFARRVVRGSATQEQQQEIRDRLLNLGELHSPKYSDKTRQAIVQAVTQAPHGHKARMAATFGVDMQKVALWKRREQQHHVSSALEKVIESYVSDISVSERESMKDVASRLANEKAKGFHVPISQERKMVTGIPRAYDPGVELEPILGRGKDRFEVDE